MDEQIKNPIDQLAYLLGAMTTRAIEAERERDAAKLDAENWYKNWQRKDEQLEECRKELEEHKKLLEAAEIRLNEAETAIEQERFEHGETRARLQKYRDMVEDGGSCDE